MVYFRDTNAVTHNDENCFIVYESSLMPLFSTCPICNARTPHRKSINGTFYSIEQSCTQCLYHRKWNSQPFVKGIPMGNILLSSAILLSGALPTVALRIFKTMKCAAINERTFFRHQKKYLQPAISLVWLNQQCNLLSDIKKSGKSLQLGGDARADSPGHTAKYGSYSMFDLSNQNIIDIQLVQVTYVQIM